MTASFIKKVVI